MKVAIIIISLLAMCTPSRADELTAALNKSHIAAGLDFYFAHESALLEKTSPYYYGDCPPSNVCHRIEHTRALGIPVLLGTPQSVPLMVLYEAALHGGAELSRGGFRRSLARDFVPARTIIRVILALRGASIFYQELRFPIGGKP